MGRLISSPLEFPDCALWLDAVQGVTLDGSSNVSQWNDLSGNANHAAQATAGFRPAMTTVNGKPALAFDGVDDVLTLTANIVPKATSIFAVCRFRVVQTNYRAVITTKVNGLYASLGGSADQWGAYTDINKPAGELMGTTLGVYTLLRADEPAGNVHLRSNGIQRALYSQNTTQNRTGSEIGTIASIDVAEIIVFNRALSDGHAELIEQYLSRKWGLYPFRTVSVTPRALAAPTELTGCVLWLDAAVGVTLTSGAVSQWNDQSGNANHAVQATAGFRPTVVTVNAKPALSFDGVDDQLIATNNLTTVAGSVFVVAAYRGTPSSYRLLFGTSQNAIYSTLAGSSGQWGTYTNNEKPAGELMGTTMRVFADLRKDEAAGNIRLRANGLPVANFGQNGLLNRSVTEIGGNLAGAQFSPVDIAEVIAFDRALTEGEAALVERYLAKKWNLYTPRALVVPTDVAGCVLWLDAAVGVTQSGGAVSQWNDQSASANHFAQATAGSKPTYLATGGPGGVPTISFDGVDDRLDAASNITYPAGVSIFAVLSDASPGRGVILATREWLLQSHVFTGEFAFLGSSNDGLGFPIGGFGFKVISSVNTTTLAVLRMDGNTAVGVVGGANTRTTSSIGQDPSFLTRIATMKLCELIVFNRQVTDGERVLVERYLEKKYNLGRGRTVFAPTDIHACALWLDASDLTSLTKDGSNVVSQWADKSGNAYHMVQSDNAKRPVYTANELAGQAAIVFPGAGQTLFNAALPLPTNNTVFLVWKHYGDFVASTSDEVFSAISTTGYQLYLGAGPALNYFGGSLSFAVPAVANQYQLTMVQVNGTDRSAVRTNGVTVLRSKRTFSAAATGIRLAGYGADPVETREAHCAFAEVLIFGRELTDGEIALVEGYLAKKYNLAGI